MPRHTWPLLALLKAEPVGGGASDDPTDIAILTTPLLAQSCPANFIELVCTEDLGLIKAEELL
jgi:hypothetical protein